jgi:hypothetical protein
MTNKPDVLLVAVEDGLDGTEVEATNKRGVDFIESYVGAINAETGRHYVGFVTKLGEIEGVYLDPAEVELFKRQARLAGVSVGNWVDYRLIG